MLRPARRSGASASRSSATVRRVFMARGVSRVCAPASSRVWSTSASNRSSSSGAASATARRCAVTVASSPRAIGPVSACSGPCAATFSTVCAHERQQQPPRLGGLEPRPGGDPLGGRLEGDQEVGGDRGGRVVGGAALVVDLERRHAERARELDGEGERLRRRAGDRAAGAGEGVGVATGEGLERVQAERGPAGRRESAERGGAAGVADERCGAGHGRGGRLRSPRRGRTAGSRRSGAAPRRGRAGPRRRPRPRAARGTGACPGDRLRRRPPGRRGDCLCSRASFGRSTPHFGWVAADMHKDTVVPGP